MKKKTLAWILVLQMLFLAAIPAGAQDVKGSFNPSTMEYNNYTLYFDNNRAQWDGVEAQYFFWDNDSDAAEVQNAVLTELDNGLYGFTITGKGELEITFYTPDRKKQSMAFLIPDESGSVCNLYSIEPTFYYTVWGDAVSYYGTWMKRSEYTPGMKYTKFFKKVYEDLSATLDYYAEGELKPESLQKAMQALLEAAPIYNNPNGSTQEEIDRQAHILQDIELESYDFIYGDVNLNGKIDVGDILLLQKYLAKTEDLSEFQVQLSQVRGRNETTMRDVLCIQNYLAKNISVFPADDYSQEPITVYFDNASYQWKNVYCYYYFPEEKTWPGTKMEPVGDDLYKITIYDYHDAYVMFNNNAGVQYPAQNEMGFYVFSGDTVLFRDGKLIYDYVPAA